MGLKGQSYQVGFQNYIPALPRWYAFMSNTRNRITTGSNMHLIIQPSNIFSINNIIIVKEMLDDIN